LFGETVSYSLLAALMDFAPTGDDQKKCADMYRKAQSEGADEMALRTLLIDTLSDGIHHGNWPWIKVNG